MRRAELGELAAVHGHGEVVEGPGEKASSLLRVERHLIALMGVQQAVGRRAIHIEAERIERARLMIRVGIQAERDEVGDKEGIALAHVSDGAVVALARERERPRRFLVRAMRERGLAASDNGVIRGRVRVPLLRFAADREMRREKKRLREIRTDTAVERRVACMEARRPRAAEEIHVVVFPLHALLLLGAVADAEVQPLMLPFGHGDFRHDGIASRRLNGRCRRSTCPVCRLCQARRGRRGGRARRFEY